MFFQSNYSLQSYKYIAEKNATGIHEYIKWGRVDTRNDFFDIIIPIVTIRQPCIRNIRVLWPLRK
jgi:hypothetical protein